MILDSDMFFKYAEGRLPKGRPCGRNCGAHGQVGICGGTCGSIRGGICGKKRPPLLDGTKSRFLEKTAIFDEKRH